MQSMKYISIIFSFLMMLSLSGFSRQARKQLDSVADVVQIKFNINDGKGLYDLTSPVFKAKMTEAQFSVGMNEFVVKAGRWKNHKLAAHTEKGADYLVDFERGQQVFVLKLDGKGKINRMNFTAATMASIPKDFHVKTNNPMRDSTDLLVERLVRPYIQKGNTAGICLSLVAGGKTRYYSYGEVEKNTGKLPDPSLNIFEIGSVSKTFTSLLLAQAVVSGEFKLDDPINKYLPDSLPALSFKGHAVTLKHLSTHTSTLPRLPANIFLGNVDPKDPYQHYQVDSLFSFLKHYRLERSPGESYAYSNLGAGLLGNILERMEGRGYEDMVLRQICRPLGMTKTSVVLSAEANKNFAQGYNEKGEATSAWDLASLKGSGAIRSTLKDMTIYIQAQLDKKTPLKEAISLSQQTAFENGNQKMGLGWLIATKGANSYFHHSGGTGGFRSFVGFDVQRRIGIVILSNTAEDVTGIGQGFF